MKKISRYYLNLKKSFFKLYPGLRVFFYEKHPRLRRILKFLLAGGTATISDLIFLYILYGLLHLDLIFSTSTAFILSFAVSFVLQKYWTFKNFNQDLMYQQMFAYLMFAFFNLNINGWAMHLMVNGLNVQYLISQVIVSGTIGIESYLCYKFFIFRAYEDEIQKRDFDTDRGTTLT